MDIKQSDMLLHAIQKKLISWRRDFHAHPELAFEEVRTSRIVAQHLRLLGLDVQTGVAKTGVVARLCGMRPGKTIALRADMDALSIQDVKTCEYASQVPGKMHACGHDAHTAMLLATATVLTQLRSELDGNVLFLFQPAEEGPGGALPMIEANVLDGVDLILAQHVLPVVPAGFVAVRDGITMAASDEFRIVVLGVGGHGATPHQAIDAIQVAGQVIISLNTIVAREVDPLQSVVLSLGTVQGGYQYNVIADSVELKGTVRTFSTQMRDEMAHKIENIVRGITSTYGARYEFEYIKNYPPLVNHPTATNLIRRVGSQVVGADKVIPARAVMGGEDFAFYLQKVPGCFFWLGAKHPQPVHEGYNLHHPGFDIDERALLIGVQMFVEATMSYLRETSNGKQEDELTRV